MRTEALFIFCLIAVSFSTELNPYMESSQSILTQIQETHFGKGMLSLLKVHTTLGNSYDQILALLTDVQTHIEQERDFDVQNWGTAKAIIEGIISDAETQFEVNSGLVESQTEALAQARATLLEAQDDAAAGADAVTRLDGQIGQQEGLIESEADAFGCRQDRDAEAVAACNAALDLLRGFCDDDDSSSDDLKLDPVLELAPVTMEGQVHVREGLEKIELAPVTIEGGMFLQVSQLSDVKKVTEQFRELGKTDVKYLPLINALTQLAQGGNYATVDEVIVLITELRDEIQSAFDLDAATYPVNLAGWQQTLGDLVSQRATQDARRIAAEAQIVFQREQIEATQASLAIVTGLRDDATDTLATKRPELEAGEANFASRQALRAQQLEIIDQVKQIFVQDYTAAAQLIQTL